MVDFTNTQIEPLHSAVTPPQPVEDISGIVSTQAMGQGFSNALDILGKTIRSSVDKSSNEAADKVMVGFTEELGRIDNALQQGSISTQEASARKRSALITYSANNPSISKDLRSTFTSLSGKPGFGEATPEQKARDDSLEKATTFGFVADGMSPTEKERGLQNYNSIQREQFELEQAQQRLNYAKNELDMDSKQMKMEEDRYNMKLRSALPSFGNAFFDQVQLGVDKVLGSLGSSVDGNAMAVRQLQQMKADYLRQSSQFSVGADETTRASIKSIGAPIEQMLDDAMDVANGKMSREVFDNAVNNNSSKSLLMLGSRDPRIWGIIGTSEFSPDLANIVAMRTPGLMENTLTAISNPNSVNITAPGSELSQPYYQSLGAFNNRITTNQLPAGKVDGAKAEFADRNNGVLKSVHHNSSVYESGTDLKPTVNYLASDTFKQHVQSGKMDSASAEKALRVVQDMYMDDLMPQIEKLMSSNPEAYLGKVVAGAAGAEALRAGAENAQPEAAGSVSDMVEWGWNGQGITFRPAAGGDPRVNKIAAQRLNKEVAPLVNQSTKAIAHLEGADNYEKVFNEQVGPNIGLGVEEQGSDSSEPITPNERINNAFEDAGAEESAPTASLTPNERIDNAFEATSDLEEINPIDVPGSAGPQTVATDGQEAIEAATSQPTQETSPEASQAVSGGMSTSDMVKASRQAAVEAHFDPDSPEGMAYSSKVYRRMLKKSRADGAKAPKVGREVTGGQRAVNAYAPTKGDVKFVSANKNLSMTPEVRARIFKGESGGDYDALFGFSNRDGKAFSNIKLTEMTLDEALSFSNPKGVYGTWVKNKIGRVATPMGAYQIVGTTLRAAKKGLGLTGNEVMTPELQDIIGDWILKTQGTGAWEGY